MRPCRPFQSSAQFQKADVSSRQPLAAVLKNPLQYAGLVSHEAVNANVEESLHLLFVINRPDMDLNAASVRSPHKAGRRDRDGMKFGGTCRTGNSIAGLGKPRAASQMPPTPPRPGDEAGRLRGFVH